MYAIEAKGLVKQFDCFHAVDGVDLKIPEGSIFGILGLLVFGLVKNGPW
jgi:ABC-2 type transport system ATP-binding protein